MRHARRGGPPSRGRAPASVAEFAELAQFVSRDLPHRIVVERHRRRLHGRARRITIDLDPTDDPTHGAQQHTFFNGHYDGWCYLPLLAFVTFNEEIEQYLCAAILRPGNAPATRGALGLLRRLLPRLRRAFPRARFLVRLDGGFATPALLEFLDAEPTLDYVVAMAGNAVLKRVAEPAMTEARALSEASGQTAHVFTETRYAARTWRHARRIVIKAEVVRLPGRDPRDNPRFVITNFRPSPRFVTAPIPRASGADRRRRCRIASRSSGSVRTTQGQRFLAGEGMAIRSS